MLEPSAPEAPGPAGELPKAPAPPPQNYAFVANIARLPVEAFEVAPGHVLRRATAAEIAVIRETVAILLPGPGEKHYWELTWPLTGPRELLPEIEWRYFVVAFSGFTDDILDLQAAFDLSPVELEIVFTILPTAPDDPDSRNTIWDGGRLFQFFEHAPSNPAFFLEVRPGDLQATREICDRMKAYKAAALVDVAQFARRLGDLKTLPKASPLRFLGYFAILESLLTHLPNKFDPHESITRQVLSKIALLDNRWTPRLDYAPFGKTKPKKVWTLMYAYRSKLAHGDKADFRGDLAALGTPEQALHLVKETVKAVIRYALIDPRLLVDLRDC